MFKVGDKVRVTGTREDNDVDFTGNEFSISDVDSVCGETCYRRSNGNGDYFYDVELELVEPNTIKENPSSITIKQNYELYIQGQTFSLSKSEFEQLKEQVNG